MHTALKTETKAKTVELQKQNNSAYINVWGYTEILPKASAN